MSGSMASNGHSPQDVYVLGAARTPIGRMMGGLATLTATTVTPLDFIRRCISTSDGTSSTQGAHHVAQKFSTTIWP